MKKRGGKRTKGRRGKRGQRSRAEKKRGWGQTENKREIREKRGKTGFHKTGDHGGNSAKKVEGGFEDKEHARRESDDGRKNKIKNRTRAERRARRFDELALATPRVRD